MHLTDEQLNEYLDNETEERTRIESHLSTCAECAARLTALEALFAELESLPELELTQSLAARFTLHATPSLPAGLPRWLTLTATLQTAFALIALFLAAPFIATLIPVVEVPSFTEVFIDLQSLWRTLHDVFSAFQLPTLPQLSVPELPSLLISLTLAGVSMLWLVGNGLLLRKQIK